MTLILGIGNFGAIYEGTRHNSGFQALDLFSSDLDIPIERKNFQSLCGKGIAFNEEVLLLKPQTFVNNSGIALKEAMQFYKIPKEDVIILVDDMDTLPGHVRLRYKGAAGGHNGLKSIISVLGSEEFKRIRIGIGRPSHSSSIVRYVLSSPSGEEEYNSWKDGISLACSALEYSLKYSFDKAMNKFNC